jgi:hypothetical protein
VLLAKTLADEGLRVLLVDADAEAPSLDTLLSVVADTPEATLMGLCGWADSIRPIARTYVGKNGGGEVDLLACRPRSDAYDLDFAAFLLSVGLDARALESATRKLRAYVEPPEQAKYNVVLFDHRTGLAPTVLPIMNAWPGPAVLFARLDAMSYQIPDTKIFDILLSHDRETPGAFVTFALDSKATRESVRDTHGKVIEGLLGSLLDALALDNNEFDVEPATLEPNWIMWQYDPALLFRLPPNPQELTPENQRSLAQLREVLGLEQGVLIPQEKSTELNLTLSGATDEGWFIRTQDLDRLFSRDSKFIYILGRKGTGKTRVLRQLHLEGLGEPLLVASDFPAGGIRSLSPTLEELMRRCRSEWDCFWWTLLRAALECNSTNEDQLAKKIDALSADPDFQPGNYGTSKHVEAALKNRNQRRVFLIDGVETAVRAADLRSFVESLFRFMATIQYNPFMSNLITVRLFLRIDLAKGGAQNVEQQMDGRQLRLNWDKTAILNFALARIASLNWFQNNFQYVCKDIENRKKEIARGMLTDDDAEDLLLKIFPKSLERNKLKTTTFFASYFSDSGDADNKASFYPRLFDNFFRQINTKADEAVGSKPAVKDGRLNSPFVLSAYDAACADFLNDVRAELYSLLDLVEDHGANRDAVDQLIESFSGRKTPFLVDEMVENLSSSASISPELVRQSLTKMKSLGIFEDRPGYSGYWRTGRVYKSGLNMKYVRSAATASVSG